VVLWYNRCVPDFTPFAGIRYDRERFGAELDAIVAPPYDVIDDELQATLEAADEHNSVRLILPRDASAVDDRYERAAATCARWLDDGVLVRDGAPRFYAYRMEYDDPHGARRHTRGVIGAMALPEPGDDSVLPHERTLPKAKSDRLSLLRATRLNADPIWALSLGSGLTDLLRSAVPLSVSADPDGTRHELGVIDDSTAIAAIAKIVGDAPLVLADGHHRFETACNYRNELRASGADVGGADAIMTFVVELVDDELCIEPIHRMLELPPDVDLRSRLAGAFDIRDAGAITPEGVDNLVGAMREQHALGLIQTNGLALAIPRNRADAVDAAVVEEQIVPLLPDATWQYRHDAHAIAALVDKGVVSAAILCSPVSVAQTRAAAEARMRMPQKTTFFWPKPRTGMVFRSLD
jgi:uncharacterized protein (DUF1015 family)